MQGGRIIATARREIGVRDSVLSGRPRQEGLFVAVREVIAEICSSPAVRTAADRKAERVDLIVAVGHAHLGGGAGRRFLTWWRPRGWTTWRGRGGPDVPEIAAEPIHFVPGLRTPPARGPTAGCGPTSCVARNARPSVR